MSKKNVKELAKGYVDYTKGLLKEVKIECENGYIRLLNKRNCLTVEFVAKDDTDNMIATYCQFDNDDKEILEIAKTLNRLQLK